MSYTIYTTRAFLFKKKEFGESGMLYSFFTEKYGRIDAAARGVRYLKSKLRYSLSGLSFLRISFVATSGGYWRLIDAEEVFILDRTRNDARRTKSSFVLFSLVDRLIQGQDADTYLWEKFKNIFLFLERKNISSNELKNFEILSAVHILNHLGYMGGEIEGRNLSLDKIGADRKYFLSLVKESIEQSQL